MFRSLQPILSERNLHLLLTLAPDDRIVVYVEPVQLDTDKKDTNAFTTPLRCEGTADELEAELPAILAEWVANRAAVTTSLRAQLEEAKAQAEAAATEARKKLKPPEKASGKKKGAVEGMSHLATPESVAAVGLLCARDGTPGETPAPQGAAGRAIINNDPLTRDLF